MDNELNAFLAWLVKTADSETLQNLQSAAQHTLAYDADSTQQKGLEVFLQHLAISNESGTKENGYFIQLPLDRYQAFVERALQTSPLNETLQDLVGLKCRFFYHNQSIGVGFNAVPYRNELGYIIVDNQLAEAHIDLRTNIEIKAITMPSTIVTDKSIERFVYLQDKVKQHVTQTH